MPPNGVLRYFYVMFINQLLTSFLFRASVFIFSETCVGEALFVWSVISFVPCGISCSGFAFPTSSIKCVCVYNSIVIQFFIQLLSGKDPAKSEK